MTREDLRFTEHAAEKLPISGVTIDDVLWIVEHGEVIESYPEHWIGPCQLSAGVVGEKPVHVVWAGDVSSGTVIVITEYVPDPARWQPDWKTRRPR